jgi:RHS repeat-associated protein
VIYDAAGNLTYWNGNSYQYDRFNQVTRMAAGTETWLYMYDADDERVWAFKEGAVPRFDRWTLRDLDGRVLRTYEATNYVWSWSEDHVYRGNTLLASVKPTGTSHLHTDHLGTVRAITNAASTRTSYHVYYPFGEEATGIAQDTQRMKFTGHERDLGVTTSAADDLDYMHARFHNPQTGRFLGTDRFDVLSLQFGDEEDVGRFREYLGTPQSWNRYAYAKNSPLRYVDPDGEEAVAAVATGTWLIGQGGSGAGAGVTLGGTGLATGVATGGAILGAAAVGYGFGTLIRQIPGVDEGVHVLTDKVVDFIFTAQNTRHNANVVNGLIAGAQIQLDNIAAAGGPGQDPDFRHHQKEIKAILDRAVKVAKRLPGRLQNKVLRRIQDIADKAGVRLAK